MKARGIAIILALCMAMVVPAPLLFAQQQQTTQQDIQRKMAALRAQLELIEKQAEMKGEMEAKQKMEFDKQYDETSKKVMQLQNFTEKYCCE